MKKYTHIIGIDPDTDKSGVAILNTQNRKIVLYSYAFPELLEYFQNIAFSQKPPNVNYVVVIEAGWLHTKSDFRDVGGRRGTRIAKNVGANHETGKKLVEMCQHYGLDVVPHIPLKKYWQGPGGKITHEELSYFTGITGRTNQEQRDAALLAWCYANLPVRVKKFA